MSFGIEGAGLSILDIRLRIQNQRHLAKTLEVWLNAAFADRACRAQTIDIQELGHGGALSSFADEAPRSEDFRLSPSASRCAPTESDLANLVTLLGDENGGLMNAEIEELVARKAIHYSAGPVYRESRRAYQGWRIMLPLMSNDLATEMVIGVFEKSDVDSCARAEDKTHYALDEKILAPIDGYAEALSTIKSVKSLKF